MVRFDLGGRSIRGQAFGLKLGTNPLNEVSGRRFGILQRIVEAE